MSEPVNQTERIRCQLKQLLAQDLSGMGYQARVRQQRRIDALRGLCAENDPQAHHAVAPSTEDAVASVAE